MTAQRHWNQVAIGLKAAPYGLSITTSDLIMPDGVSLEHRGVTPDQLRLPSPDDLAAGLDVVLSYAVSLFGVTLNPVEAANLFRIEPVESKQKVK